MEASALFASMRDDLELAYAHEFNSGNEGPMVEALESRGQILKAAFKAAEDYTNLIEEPGTDGKTDLADLPVDLLGVAGREDDEVAHTQVIANLIRPRESGDANARSLLGALHRAAGVEIDDNDIGAALVRAEARQEVASDVIVPDILIDITTPDGRHLIVLENKIGTQDPASSARRLSENFPRARPLNVASRQISLTCYIQGKDDSMDLSPLTVNLRRLRTARKLSQGDLAEQAGLSREGYRRMEEGVVEPRVDSLMRVARVLEVRPEQLLVAARQLTAVRFRAQKRMTSREDLLANIGRWLEDYAELEQLVGDVAPFRLEALARTLRSGSKQTDPIVAAAKARHALGLGENEPIRDIGGLLEDNGVKLFKPSLSSEGFFGLSVGQADGGPAVVVNCWDRISVERWIFTAAHELGHLLLHLDAYDVAKSEEDAGQEAEANLFASHFLMPEKSFLKEWNAARGVGLVERVFKVKRIFHVSWKTVVYRAAVHSPEPNKAWPQFYGAYKRTTGKALRGIDEPDGLGAGAFLSHNSVAPVARVADEPEHLLASDFVEDRLLRMIRRGVEGGLISLSRAAEILDVDLRSMRQLAGSWVE